MTMNCREVDRLLGLFIDSELSPETNYAMAEHLDRCSACAAKVEAERRLEQQMRSALLEPSPDDDIFWDGALQAALHRSPARSVTRSRFALWAGALAVAAALVVALFPRSHPELDLAQAASADHVRFVSEVREGGSPRGTLAELSVIAENTLVAQPAIPSVPPPGFKVVKVGHCTLDAAPVAYAVLSRGQDSVSLFLMDRERLRGFPAAETRYAKEPSGITCKVDGRAFFMTGASGLAACGVGDVRLSELRDLVRWLLSG